MADKAKVQHEIDFLSGLEQGEVVTQMSLAKRASVSVGLINALLKRAINKGFVKAKAAPYKRYAYYLTPKGFHEKSRLVAEYLEVSLNFFRQARAEYLSVFSQLKGQHSDRVVLAGRGELSEIAHMAASEADVVIVGIYDNASNLPERHNIPILRTLGEAGDFDAIVIVESREPQKLFDDLKRTVDPKKILAPDFLRITRDELDFEPPDIAPKGASR